VIYFKKLFKLPGPVALGMSDNDHAMASEFFRNNPEEYTWEMYYDKLKELYPVRFFFASTLPEFFRRRWWSAKRPFEDAYYWLKCNLITDHKYHLVDIRKATDYTGPPRYTHGWIDTNWRMVYAMFSLLIDFVEKEMPHSYSIPSEEDAAKDDGTYDSPYSGYKAQLERHKEYMAIYKYWTQEYPAEEEARNKLTLLWSTAHRKNKGSDNEETEKLWNELQVMKDTQDKRLEEILHRLIDVRHYLWS
jgi:hypothetical protein